MGRKMNGWQDGEMRKVELNNGREMYQCENGGLYDATVGLWVKGPPNLKEESQRRWCGAMNSLDAGLGLLDNILTEGE